MRNIKVLVLLAGLVFSAAITYASVQGPEPGYTGAPGDIGTCVNCHDTFHEANVGPGSVRLAGNPGVYEPGEQYTLSVIAQQAGRARFGFQLTAIASDGTRAGTLTPLGGDTQINFLTGPGNRQYIQHTEPGTSTPVTGTKTWQVRWTAPSTDIGTVRFYLAGNATNSSGDQLGDYIYTNASFSESPGSVVNLTFVSQPGGLTLEARSTYVINWAATNPSNIQSLELRYSTDDGATFPITNLINSTTNPNTTSFEWTVPNTPTDQARIRLQAATMLGAAVEVMTGRFTISGSGGGGSSVSITGATVTGRKLFVQGEGFQMGAIVELNGQDQKTINLDDFSHQLRCKKAGNKIAPSDTVMLAVRNPDGSRSEPFTYTRPIE